MDTTSSPVDKRAFRIRRMFGNIACSYDFLNHLLSLNIDRRWRRRTTRLVPPQGEAPILDLCTGTGDLALAYDRAARHRVPIYAADFCHEMLVLAGKKTQQRRFQIIFSKLRQSRLDCETLPTRTVASRK